MIVTAKEYWGSAGAGILFTTGKKILLLKRSKYVNEPGTWGIAGGKREPGETFLKAAKREATEELGKLPSYAVKGKHVYKDGDFIYMTFIFRVKEEFIPKLNWENNTYKWVTTDEARKMKLHFGTKDLMKKKINAFVNTTPKYFYLVFPVDFDSNSYKWAKELATGKMKGVAGVSESPTIIKLFKRRHGIIVMRGKDFLKENKVSKIQYDNIHYLVQDDLKVLSRLFNTEERIRGKQQIMATLCDYVAKNADAKYQKLFDEVTHIVAGIYEKSGKKFKGVFDLSSWLFYMYSKLGLQNKIFNSKKDFVNKVVFKRWVLKALYELGQRYSYEEEWVVKNTEINVPKKSTVVLLNDKQTDLETVKEYSEKVEDIIPYNLRVLPYKNAEKNKAIAAGTKTVNKNTKELKDYSKKVRNTYNSKRSKEIKRIRKFITEKDRKKFNLADKEDEVNFSERVFNALDCYTELGDELDKKMYDFISRIYPIKKKLILYRGLEDRNSPVRFKKLKDNLSPKGKEIKVRTKDPTSWSSSLAEAKIFAKKNPRGNGLVIKTVASKKDVLVDFRNTLFDLGEKEVLLKPGEMKISLVWIKND